MINRDFPGIEGAQCTGTSSHAGAAANAATQPVSVPCHIQLYDSMVGLNSIIFHLEDLLVRINDTPPEQRKEDSAGHTPSLVEVLKSGSAIINDATAESHRLISAIEEILLS